MRSTAILLAVVVAMTVAGVSAWHRDTHWERIGFAPDDAVMRLSLALKQRNLGALERLVQDVSDPTKPTYGQYWSLAQITKLVAPVQSDIDVVMTYLHSIGARRAELTASRDFIVLEIAVADLESALGADIHAFRHKASSRLMYRADNHSVRFPPHIHAKLDLVTGLSDMVDYPHERKAIIKQHRAKQIASDASCTSSAPDIEGRILGGSGDIGVQFTVYCKNGQPSTNLANPCADFPPALSAVTLTYTPQGHPTQTATAPVSQLSCKFRGPNVFCIL